MGFDGWGGGGGRRKKESHENIIRKENQLRLFLVEASGNRRAIEGFLMACVNKGFSILRHLQGKGCKTGLCGQAWSFPLFDPM